MFLATDIKGVVLAIISVISLLLYRHLVLVKPIGSIPHRKRSILNILGDAPTLIRHKLKHGTAFDCMTDTALELDSPIFQLFLRPFGRPLVFVVDPRESQDILSRRNKEFDRSPWYSDVFGTTVPEHHISMPTNDVFRKHRKWLADTMSNGFLHDVAGPSLHKQVSNLINLWSTKTRMGYGRSFSVEEDINHMSLDSIWAVAFGTDIDTIKAQDSFLQASTTITLPQTSDSVIVFPKAPLPSTYNAIITLTDAMEAAVTSPLPRQAHWLTRQTPSYRRASGIKNDLITSRLQDAKKRLLDPSSTDEMVTCASDFMVRREQQAADKEGRAPEYETTGAQDELFGFLIGGHDTVSATLMWTMKFLADHADVQSQLRRTLHAAHGEPRSEDRVPTAEEITAANDMPFFDAVMEEAVRCACTAPGATRLTTVDTVILGHHIPKGTDVFLMSNGPGYITPDRFTSRIREEDRSASSREAKDRVGKWDDEDIGSFKPERWARKDEQGNEVFDPKAGPSLQFGAGIRGCFGKKLAYLEMRILLTLVVWRFEFLKCPTELSGYEARDCLTHKPTHCYVRLRQLSAKE